MFGRFFKNPAPCLGRGKNASVVLLWGEGEPSAANAMEFIWAHLASNRTLEKLLTMLPVKKYPGTFNSLVPANSSVVTEYICEYGPDNPIHLRVDSSACGENYFFVLQYVKDAIDPRALNITKTTMENSCPSRGDNNITLLDIIVISAVVLVLGIALYCCVKRQRAAQLARVDEDILWGDVNLDYNRVPEQESRSGCCCC